MVSYTLVRERRLGRQSIEELIHIIENDNKKTLCGNYNVDEMRAVRTLGVYNGDSPICSECSKKADILDI